MAGVWPGRARFGMGQSLWAQALPYPQHMRAKSGMGQSLRAQDYPDPILPSRTRD